MAARRLAISSLLCSDDTAADSHPSSFPSHSVDTPDAQPGTTHTPSPRSQDAILHSQQRRGYKEMVFDNGSDYTRHQPAPSDPTTRYVHQPHSPPDSAFAFPRPSSSRSAQSDSPLASAFPRPQSSQSYAHSPSHSPISGFRPPSHSPIVPLQRASPSPVHPYHLPQPYSPYAHARSPDRLHLQSTPPNSFNAHPSPRHLSPVTRPTLSALLTHSPPVSRASAASLPNILNAMPPTSADSLSGGYGALEALVQVATEERRRLSGELPAVNTPESEPCDMGPVRGASPLTTRRVSPIVDKGGQHPASPNVHVPYHPHRRQGMTSPLDSPDRWPVNSFSQLQMTDVERPAKRRRSSAATRAVSHEVPHLREAVWPISSLPSSAVPPSLPSPSRSHPPPQIYVQDVAPPRALSPDCSIGVPAPIKPIVVEQHVVGSSKLGSPAQSGSKPDSGTAPKDKSPRRRSDRDEGESGRVKKAPRSTSAQKEKGAAKEQETASRDHKQPGKASSQEEDPHEWLLEHYTAPSPPTAPMSKSPQPPSRPSHRVAVDTSRLKQEEEEEDPEKPPPVVDVRRVATKPKKDARTSEADKQFKVDVDGAPQSDRGPAETQAKGARTGDLDIDLELGDLVAGAASSESERAVTTTATAKFSQADDAMDLDVEDELLSLLDDKPRSSSHSSRPVSVKSPVPPPPHLPDQFRPKPSHHNSKSSANANGAHRLSATRSPSLAAPPHPSERGSMPPPTSTSGVNGPREDASGAASAKKGGEGSSSTGATAKKKDTAQKTVPKTKQPAKPKAKATAKAKPKAAKDGNAAAASTLAPGATLTATAPKGKKASPLPGSGPPGTKRGAASAAAAASRSRSTSVMPGGSVGPEAEKKTPGNNNDAEGAEEEDEGVDDRLYCVCRTGYDEDRVMIACDRCDEWYHTQCVNMPDLEVDLVDQFICPVCIANNPGMALKTTYKRRCLHGLKHPHPSSPSACHKPARGAFSKYCSDECGILYMNSRIDSWGGDKERLWESVKDAERREGVVVRCVSSPGDQSGNAGSRSTPPDAVMEVIKPAKTRAQRELDHLNARLEKIAQRREGIKKEMEVVLWREKLVDLATARAEGVDECGWDQRLCFGDEECAEFGADVLESYEEDGGSREGREGGDAMQVDGGVAAEEGEWWCRGKKKCERHAGWQKLRQAEVSFEKETIEAALSKLTTEEREIRKQIEDVAEPKAQTSSAAAATKPLQPLNGPPNTNGASRAKPNGDSTKKGKKRKDAS